MFLPSSRGGSHGTAGLQCLPREVGVPPMRSSVPSAADQRSRPIGPGREGCPGVTPTSSSALAWAFRPPQPSNAASPSSTEGWHCCQSRGSGTRGAHLESGALNSGPKLAGQKPSCGRGQECCSVLGGGARTSRQRPANTNGLQCSDLNCTFGPPWWRSG